MPSNCGSHSGRWGSAPCSKRTLAISTYHCRDAQFNILKSCLSHLSISASFSGRTRATHKWPIRHATPSEVSRLSKPRAFTRLRPVNARQSETLPCRTGHRKRYTEKEFPWLVTRIQISRIDAIWGRLDHMSRPDPNLQDCGWSDQNPHLQCAVIHPRIVHGPPNAR
jgi:hypothetical protein